MKTETLTLIGFFVGLLFGEALRSARDWLTTWKLEREFRAAQTRMEACTHTRTVLVDVGMGPVTPKCLECWALQIGAVGKDSDSDEWHTVGVQRWTCNSTPPPGRNR